MDIAVDETVKTASGFKPHIALLSTTGDLFICNLLAFEQPTLFWIRKISNLDNFFRLFYDKGQCAVLYANNNVNYINIHVWPDYFTAQSFALCMGSRK